MGIYTSLELQRFTAGAWCWEYISISAVTAAGGFAFTASHLEKPQVTKGSCPAIRCLAQARHALTPALLRGPAAIGHPWPAAATAASLPRCPLRNTCVRPLGKGQADQDQKPKQQQRQRQRQRQRQINGRSTADQQHREQARSHRRSGYIRGKIGRLTGRHRSDAATRQASSHKKSAHIQNQRPSTLLFTTQQAER